MQENERQILSQLLDLAADVFANHGCNDFSIPDTPENRALVRRAELEAYAVHDADLVILDSKIITDDNIMMRYFAKRIKEDTR